jgi:hypothetical protein
MGEARHTCDAQVHVGPGEAPLRYAPAPARRRVPSPAAEQLARRAGRRARCASAHVPNSQGGKGAARIEPARAPEHPEGVMHDVLGGVTRSPGLAPGGSRRGCARTRTPNAGASPVRQPPRVPHRRDHAHVAQPPGEGPPRTGKRRPARTPASTAAKNAARANPGEREPAARTRPGDRQTTPPVTHTRAARRRGTGKNGPGGA